MPSLRRLATFLKPYKLWVVLAPLFMLIEVSMDLLQPRLVQRVIDVGIAQNDSSVIV